MDDAESLDDLSLDDFMRRVDAGIHDLLADVDVRAFRLQLDAADLRGEEGYRAVVEFLAENLGSALGAIQHLREVTHRLALEVIELQARE